MKGVVSLQYSYGYQTFCKQVFHPSLCWYMQCLNSWCCGWLQTPNDVIQRSEKTLNNQQFPQYQETPLVFSMIKIFLLRLNIPTEEGLGKYTCTFFLQLSKNQTSLLNNSKGTDRKLLLLKMSICHNSSSVTTVTVAD